MVVRFGWTNTRCFPRTHFRRVIKPCTQGERLGLGWSRGLCGRRSFSSARKVIRPKPPPGFAMLEKECLPHRLGFVMVDLHGAILSHAVSFTTRLRYEKSRRILKHVLKPWPNGLASRRKFWTCVQLAFRLATHLRRLALTCVDLRRLGSPFGQGFKKTLIYDNRGLESVLSMS